MKDGFIQGFNAQAAVDATAQHGAAAPEPQPAKPQSRVAAMADKLRRAGHQGPYRLRKQVVEPVFGQIKQARGFRQFLRRGLAQV